MLVPLVILSVFSILLGFLGTPAWPWFQAFLDGQRVVLSPGRLTESGVLGIMALSTAVVFAGIGLGWWFYGRKPITSVEQADPLERARPDVFALLRRKYFVDEIYEWSVVRFNAWWARTCDWLDRWVWNGVVLLFAYTVLGLCWLNRFFDEYFVNPGFDEGCGGIRAGGGWMSRLQNGRVQNYLRVIGLGLIVLVLMLIWGGGNR
jgi:NADH-quinone oxidoreductase subunit L